MTTRAATVVLAAALLLGACGSDSDVATGGSSTTSTAAPTTTDEVSTTTSTPDSGSTSTTVTGGSTTSTPAEDTSTAIFPAPGSDVRYADPVDAARAFATDYVGFSDPMVSPYQAGDSRSGEVAVRPAPDGPVTTVLVRRFGDSWFVLGAATDTIVVSEPAALATVSSPVVLAGRSTAFEATVQAQVREDGASAPIGEGFVMGGSMGEMGPFTGSIDIAPTAPAGAVVLWTSSMENGQVWEAAVVRVRFSG